MGAVKCFYSGIEGEQHFNAAVSAGAKHLLTSFLYLESKKDNNVVRRRKEANPELLFMIDSGAHSFQTDPKYLKWTSNDWEEYVKRYVTWLRKNKDVIFSAVELDIDQIVGLTLVEKWQRQYFKPLQEEGLDIVYVWHQNRGREVWEEMCATVPYVGLPGELSSQKDFNTFMAVARRYTTKVHGFAASVTGDSKVWLRSKQTGVISSWRIDEVANLSETGYRHTGRKGEQFAQLTDMEVWTLDDELQPIFAPVSGVVSHSLQKRLFRIILRGGKQIVGTEDHSFFALDKSGNLVETTPLSLGVGDYLVSSLGFPKVNKPPSLGFDGNPVSLADAEFFGLWFGDGYVACSSTDSVPRHVWVSKQHVSSIQQVCHAFAERHGAIWTLANEYDGHMTLTRCAKWLANVFGRVGDEKHLSESFWSFNAELHAAFLRGYFSADGTAKGKNRLVSLSCKHRLVLEDVQLALEQWDIRSGITCAGVSGKGSLTWELAISDARSMALFGRYIGFIQSDQNDWITVKSSKQGIAGVHRGLPVGLLNVDGRLTTPKGKQRPVYAKDRRACVTRENFSDRLCDMNCEYLEISAIEELTDQIQTVYDLCVPGVERFFANGILAHNTKQADFRDWDWYSIDSITWKTAEIFGIFFDWDEGKQKLMMKCVKDPLERRQYREAFRERITKRGFNADVIIKDSDYREVTRYALWCMASMEAFYARIYATRTFYWELRLPHPKAFGAFTRSYLENIWRKMRPEDNFKEHVALTGKPLRKVLRALASVQHACLDIAKESDSVKDFLKTYFEAFAVPAMRGDAVDWKLFQKELSMRIAPKVRAALPRTERVHFEDNDLAPRAREFDFDALDLDDDDFLELFDLHELLDTFELAQVSETSRLMLPAK